MALIKIILMIMICKVNMCFFNGYILYIEFTAHIKYNKIDTVPKTTKMNGQCFCGLLWYRH